MTDNEPLGDVRERLGGGGVFPLLDDEDAAGLALVADVRARGDGDGDGDVVILHLGKFKGERPFESIGPPPFALLSVLSSEVCSLPSVRRVCFPSPSSSPSPSASPQHLPTTWHPLYQERRKEKAEEEGREGPRW